MILNNITVQKLNELYLFIKNDVPFLLGQLNEPPYKVYYCTEISFILEQLKYHHINKTSRILECIDFIKTDVPFLLGQIFDSSKIEYCTQIGSILEEINTL